MNPDRFFQFAVYKEGLTWIDGVYKTTDEEGEEKQVCVKEFFDGNYDESLVQDLVDWTVSSLKRKEVLAIPEEC